MKSFLKRVKLTIILVSSIFFLLSSVQVFANSNEMAEDGGAPKASISGYITDAKNGEALIGATISLKDTKQATVTNLYGYYSLRVAPGKYTVEASYVGYAITTKAMDIETNIKLNVELSEEAKELNEVVITSDRPEEKIKRAEMSVSKLEMKAIKKIPAFMGEVDVIKVIQMLPGVVPTAEGTSGFSVRGGGNDQNLILLDEATVYNASHLMGFFSVFNNDAIRDVKLYKGDIPANYGGRLSSVLDVRMKEGNNKKFSGTGGIGLLSSRLTLEGPIGNEKTSYLISGRRTYYDIFFPLFSDPDLKKTILYFYDMNLKINSQVSENNRLYLSAYLGRDNFGQKGSSSAGFGNKTFTFRWNHQFSNLMFSNLTAIASNYDYDLETGQGGASYYWKSNLVDYGLKADFNFYPNSENEIKFGASSIMHSINPCDAWIVKDTTTQSFPNQRNYELEHSLYISNQQKVSENLTLKYGVRYTIFQNIGEATLNHFDSNHNYLDSTYYPEGKIYNTYKNFEPRLGAIYSINARSSVKASYSRTFQYLQLASNSNGGMSLDYWFPSSPNVKPQRSDQYAIGYFRNLFDNTIETSIEAFYKNMDNVIDFRDHAVLLFNDRLEGDVRTGKAKSYGIEFMVKKSEGALNGWISYTYSRAKRTIPGINDGKEYSAPYDKPNNINIILNYELSPRTTISANWVFASGTPITFPVGSYKVDNNVVFIYSDRNAYTMRKYHRLDLSLTFRPQKKTCLPYFTDICWQGEWVFSVYNAYGRHNDWIINFVNAGVDSETKTAQRMYLPFEFLPGITYNFNF